MKKVFAIIAMMGVMTFGMTQSVFAQDEEAVDTPQKKERRRNHRARKSLCTRTSRQSSLKVVQASWHS